MPGEGVLVISLRVSEENRLERGGQMTRPSHQKGKIGY